MATITISRQFGSHGDTVAQLLCDRLGYRYFDKNLMMGLAAQSGLAAEKVVDLSDDQYRARTLLERLFGNYPAPQGDPGAWAAAAEASAQGPWRLKSHLKSLRLVVDLRRQDARPYKWTPGAATPLSAISIATAVAADRPNPQHDVNLLTAFARLCRMDV